MELSQVRVRNFRPVLDARLSCDRLTALVGRNGAGKSSFLRALELFYDPSAKVNDADFYAEDTSREIQITLTFSRLSSAALELFKPYLDGNTLSVTRVFRQGTGGRTATYHGSRLQHTSFSEVRAATSKRETTHRYRALRSDPSYKDLPTARSADAALEALSLWEARNPAACIPMLDDGQFFGFSGVAQGYLGRYTRFIRVPAVRDALADATEGRDSHLTEVMDLVIRGALSERADIEGFRRDTQAKYEELLDPAGLPELAELEKRVATTLSRYAPEASATLTWSRFAQITIPIPEAEVRLCEDGYESAVDQTGHGLQRAFIFTMLEEMAAAMEPPTAELGTGAQAGGLPSVVFAIEEPEIYQHPARQRHLASLLLKLAEGSVPGAVGSMQVVYTTHAPLFVGLDRFDQVRVLRKRKVDGGGPAATAVTAVTLEEVATRLACLHRAPPETYTAERLRPRMQALMTPWMNEGFFADVAALVEGEGDRLALLAVAAATGRDLESLGICVVPCGGKSSMDRPALVFRSLGIRTYLIWDNDEGSNDPRPNTNRLLLRLVGAAEEDWPVGVWGEYACLEGNLETTLRQEISEGVFDELLGDCCARFDMTRGEAKKNAVVLRTIVEEADKRGRSSTTLTNIVERLVALRSDASRAGRA